VSTCCPCVEQCFGHPVNVYGSEVRVSQPTCQEIFVGWGNSVFRFPSSVRIIFSDHFSASCGEPRFRQSLASAVRLRFSSAVFLASSLLSQRNFIFIFRLLAVSHVFVFNFSFRRFSSSFLLRLRFLDLDHFLLSKFPSVSILFWFSVCLMVWIGICLRARATFAAVKLLV